MNVEVKLFAVASQLAGASAVRVDVPAGATVAELRAALVRDHPELETVLAHVRFAVDAEYATDQTRLEEQSEVACIPPVSGG